MAFIDKTKEIQADVREVYAAWTAFEDFPSFMEFVETVTVLEDDRLRWVAVVEDETYEWETDLVEHVEDEKITWRAVDGRETGQVRFEKLGDGMTKVTYQLEYDSATWEGDADAVNRWMNARIDQDLEDFKTVMEAA